MRIAASMGAVNWTADEEPQASPQRTKIPVRHEHVVNRRDDGADAVADFKAEGHIEKNAPKGADDGEQRIPLNILRDRSTDLADASFFQPGCEGKAS